MHDPRLDEYLDAIAQRLRGVPRERRDEELLELRQHLESLIAAHIDQGLSESEAVAGALEQFGPSEEVGNGLRAAWDMRRARFLPPNKRAVASIASAALGSTSAFALLLDGHGSPQTLPIGGQALATLLVYMALFLVAGVAAAVARTWRATAVVPIVMLATWIVFDRAVSPDLYEGWGRTYLNPPGTRFDWLAQDSLAHMVIHAMQLIPALLGAALGCAINVGERSSRRALRSLGG